MDVLPLKGEYSVWYSMNEGDVYASVLQLYKYLTNFYHEQLFSFFKNYYNVCHVTLLKWK